MSKQILVQVIKNVEGRPLKVPAMDEDGEIIWRNKERGEFQPVDARTLDILRVVTYNIPPRLRTQADTVRAMQLWDKLDESNEHLQLKDKLYDWLHRLLERTMPQSEEEKQTKAEPQTYAMHLWGINAAKVVRQLTDPSLVDSLED